jgi:hypothetical protein
MNIFVNFQYFTFTSFMWHFCSYLTENMNHVNFKKPKILIYLGQILYWV